MKPNEKLGVNLTYRRGSGESCELPKHDDKSESVCDRLKQKCRRRRRSVSDKSGRKSRYFFENKERQKLDSREEFDRLRGSCETLIWETARSNPWRSIERERESKRKKKFCRSWERKRNTEERVRIILVYWCVLLLLPDGEAEKYKCGTPDFTTVTIFIMFVNVSCHVLEYVCMYVRGIMDMCSKVHRNFDRKRNIF